MHNRLEVVEAARKYLNTKIGDNKHKEIIDTYNSIEGHKGCVMKYTSPWCACFVSTISYLTDNLDIMFEHTSCNSMIQRYKDNGSWCENDNHIPKAGDIIFYDWDDNGIGDCTGIAEHVGIVEECDGITIKVIEGNMGSNSIVGRRYLKVNGRYIRGYGLPKYDYNYIEDTPTPSYYTVQKGDTLSGIAAKLNKQGNNIHWKRIAFLNNIKPPKYIIYPGQRLVVSE